MFNFELADVFYLVNGLTTYEQGLLARLRNIEALQTFSQGPDLLKFLRTGETTDDIKKNFATTIAAGGVGNWISDGFKEVDDEDRKHAEQWLKYLAHHAEKLELQSGIERIEIFTEKLKSDILLRDLHAEVRTLRETFERGLKQRQFYRYSREKATYLDRYRKEWQPAINAFPQIIDDVEAAVDCYAFGRNTASVFHSMRVVEHGLREFAIAVNLTFETEQWHTIIEQIEGQIRAIGEKWPRGPSKKAWMQFYSEAAKEFFYFKDGWRNYVSHGGDPYDDYRALSVIEHVKAFMNHLGNRFGGPVLPEQVP